MLEETVFEGNNSVSFNIIWSVFVSLCVSVSLCLFLPSFFLSLLHSCFLPLPLTRSLCFPLVSLVEYKLLETSPLDSVHHCFLNVKQKLASMAYEPNWPTCPSLQIKLCWNTALLIYLSIIRSCLYATQAELNSLETETIWSAKPEIFTICSFTEAVCWSLI